MNQTTLTDRERVLMNIAVDTAGTVHDEMRRLPRGWTLRLTFDTPAEQFIPEEMAKAIGMPLKSGDIVRCKTNPNHPWGISEFVERLESSEYLLRQIGGDKLLRMGNEMFDVLRFMDPSRLYTGVKFKLYQWASHDAFSERYNPDADFIKRCGGVGFDGDTLIIWCRAHIFAAERHQKDGSKLFAQPRKFTLKWNNKTKLKDIVSAMRAQKFADDFEYGPNKPTEGLAGCVTLTRDDLLQSLSASGVALKADIAHPATA